MKSSAWRAMALLSLTVFVLSMSVDANAARRSALAGNQFINDSDDMYAFPQLLLKYKNMLILQMAQSSGTNGDGSVTFGDNTVWQFNTGRSDYLNNTAWWAWGNFDRANFTNTLSNGLPSTGLVQWWDLGVAREIGGNPWGLTISWASNVDKTEGAFANPDSTVNPNPDNSTSMLGFQLGTTLGGVELALELGFGSYSDNRVDSRLYGPPQDESDRVNYSENDVSYFNLALLGRGDFSGGGLDWRYIGAFATGSTDPKTTGLAITGDFANPDTVVTSAQKLSSMAIRGSIGPVWGTPGDWEIATYLTLDYMTNDSYDDDGPRGVDLKDTDKSFTLPGYHMAMEYYITDWLAARGGVVSRYEMKTEEEEVDVIVTDPVTGVRTRILGTRTTNDREYELRWTAGIGLNKETWGLDLALNESNLFSGYVFGNGDQEGPTIAYLSAWLNW